MWGLQQEHLFLHVSYVSSDFLYPRCMWVKKTHCPLEMKVGSSLATKGLYSVH